MAIRKHRRGTHEAPVDWSAIVEANGLLFKHEQQTPDSWIALSDSFGFNASEHAHVVFVPALGVV